MGLFSFDSIVLKGHPFYPFDVLILSLFLLIEIGFYLSKRRLGSLAKEREALDETDDEISSRKAKVRKQILLFARL